MDNYICSHVCVCGGGGMDNKLPIKKELYWVITHGHLIRNNIK